MSELRDELQRVIDRAASPVSFEEIVDRSPASRARRAPVRTIMIAVVVVVAIAVGAFVVTNVDGGGARDRSSLRVAAPTVVVGDIDLAVLSTSFDADGARGP